MNNGMVVGAQAELDRKHQESEYRSEWVRREAKAIYDDMDAGEVAWECDSTYELANLLRLHKAGKWDEAHDEAERLMKHHAEAEANKRFDETDHYACPIHGLWAMEDGECMKC